MSKRPMKMAKKMARPVAGRRVTIEAGGKLAAGFGIYTAVYERDEDGVWIVHIRELPECHTYGDSISRARSKVQEALGLWVDDAEYAELVDDVRLPARAMKAIAAFQEARAAAARAQAEASERTREVVRQLRKLGLSTRDAAEVTGLSQQRIAQLAS